MRWRRGSAMRKRRWRVKSRLSLRHLVGALDAADRILQRHALPLGYVGRMARSTEHSRKSVARGLIDLLTNSGIVRVLSRQGLANEPLKIRQVGVTPEFALTSFIAFESYCNVSARYRRRGPPLFALPKVSIAACWRADYKHLTFA